MSYAALTKKELTMIEEPDCCQRAELQGMVMLMGSAGGREDGEDLALVTENVATARRVYTLLKRRCGVHPEVVVRKKMRLKKNNVYTVRVAPADAAKVLRELGWSPTGGAWLPDRLVRKACCRRAFLRGAFLAAGSVNDPGGHSYHLEITCATQAQADALIRMMNTFDLQPRLIQRKRGYVVYLKEGERIVDFMRVIGAHQALLKFEDVRILKGMRNQVNRLVNCETANLNKTILAAVRQLEVIKFIDETIGLGQLPPHLREVAEMRLRHPEVNLQELSARMPHKVSKSGLNHRLRKLEEIARSLRERGLPRRT
ncbi:putative sporulation transcription regulator WhiA [Alicyclobacillus cellulosilyticus]|uniref:Probable cell division protein WhiA n=1 Tax=Alicyclobacillus cellulosilyticus TaxID=1003997 RepID=A0A917KCT4_9BACL|nr:DNA-binding protein WhiA [Alicyclobacillus cellulosilyticus]GGJ05769.1 putative sporulation transcription regulator WhiA [Alicyclobacillus cellulosilyticus]